MTRHKHQLNSSESNITEAGGDPSMAPVVTLGGRNIGGRDGVFIVAEAGVNHDGRVETALAMVDAAADAGADAVKFQWFCAASLVSATAPTAAYQRETCGESVQQVMLERLELPEAAFVALRDHCQRRGVVFLVTSFGTSEAEACARLGVAGIKIASTDLTHNPLLEAAARTGRPVILSVGAARVEEIHRAVGLLRALGAGDRLVLLHCVSRYPTPVEELNLRAMQTLQRTFGVPCGLSDHTTSTQTGGWAVAAGACLLEKHFTLDPQAAGPDHAMSLSPAQLAVYVANARQAERCLGSGQLGMNESLEADVRAAARRSVVVSVDVPAGAVLSAEMLALKRPGTGLDGRTLPALIGRRARIDLSRDTVLTWEHLQ